MKRATNRATFNKIEPSRFFILYTSHSLTHRQPGGSVEFGVRISDSFISDILQILGPQFHDIFRDIRRSFMTSLSFGILPDTFSFICHESTIIFNFPVSIHFNFICIIARLNARNISQMLGPLIESLFITFSFLIGQLLVVYYSIGHSLSLAP